ncbi:MAG: hypothetical protein Q9205_002073 [Flavoplaca limonia]
MQDDFVTSLDNDESFGNLSSPIQLAHHAYGDCEANIFTSSAQLPLDKLDDYNCSLAMDDTKPARRRGYLENPQHRNSADDESPLGILKPNQEIPGGLRLKGPEEVRDWINETFDKEVCEYTAPVAQLSYTQQDTNRWKMAERACATFGKGDLSLNRTEKHVPFVRRCGDFRSIEVGKASVAVGFGAVAMIYGGIHAFAWLAYFRSTTEQLLWRASTCIVTAGIPLMYVIMRVTDWNHDDSPEQSNMVKALIGFLRRAETIAGLRKERGDNGFIILVLGSILFWAVVLLYVLARAYLIGECFIQLTHMPADVYKVSQWSSHFPHIS